MARFIPKQFAENSTTSVVFGSHQEQGGNVGDGTISSDPATLQGGTAWPLGWSAATDNFFKIPRGEEMEGLERVLSAAIVQQFKDGLTFWQSEMPVTQYQTIVQYQTGSDLPKLYINITGTSTSTPPDSDTTNWKELSLGGSGLEICDIGTALWIDESKGLRRWLNGQVIAINDNTQAFLTKLQSIITTCPSLSTTEENWQAEALLSADGQVGKFVIDTTAGTIRLPKIVNLQGLQDLAANGVRVDAGLPNITGAISGVATAEDSAVITDGALSKEYISTRQAETGGAVASYNTIKLNASLSNSIYGNSTTVQPESIRYPYFIQIATGAEEESTIINTLELNNPFTLFDSKYSDHEISNLSWLLSDGGFKQGSMYVTAYEALLVEMNGDIAVGQRVQLPNGTYHTKQGLSVIASTETYTDYDFVVNTADSAFRLPLLNGEENWVGNSSNTLSTANIVVGTPFTWTATQNGFITFTCYRVNMTQSVIARINGQIINFSGTSISNGTPRPGFWLKVKKGDTVSIETEAETLQNVDIAFIPATGNGSLYYYIGETVQNANLIDVSNIQTYKANTDLSNCTKPYVTETYRNGAEWYRIWSDGWCEQGGIITPAAASTIYTANFIMPFKDASSVKSMNIQSRLYSTAYQANDIINPISGSQFNYITGNPAMVNNPMYWSACGIIE